MTGTLTVGDTSTSATVATIKSSNASGTYIQFVNGTTPTVEVGYNATYGAYLYNDKLDSHPTLCLGLADNLRDAIIYKYAAVNYNVNVLHMSERILAQMMYTGVHELIIMYGILEVLNHTNSLDGLMQEA